MPRTSQAASHAKGLGDPNLQPARVRVAALALDLGSLLGCSQGGFLPGGPHALAAGQLSSLVNSTSHEFGVKPSLIYAVIDAESHGDPAAISRAGAMGIMQL